MTKKFTNSINNSTKECIFCNHKFQDKDIYSGTLFVKHDYANNDAILANIDIDICKFCMLEVYESQLFICKNCNGVYVLTYDNYYSSYLNTYDKFCKKCFEQLNCYKSMLKPI